MLVIDIETIDWFTDPQIACLDRSDQVQAIRFGIAVTYDTETHEWDTFHATDGDVQRLIHKLNTTLCIGGWNIARFDLLVIAAEAARRNVTERLAIALVCDPCDSFITRYSRYYSLETIAQRNLGQGKSANGKQASVWLRSGNPDDYQAALDYCRLDVALEAALIEQWQQHGLYLPCRPERGEEGDRVDQWS